MHAAPRERANEPVSRIRLPSSPAHGTGKAPDPTERREPIMTLKPGDRFLHFTIVRLLGEGGMGQVFEAEHEFTKRRTALKVALAKLVDADMQERMIQEARSLAELDHPNIVRLYDANLTPDGRLWLAMEFLEGRSLRAYRTTAGPLPVAQALHILIEMCDGVAAAHEIGIIHRDLKPENVQLTPQNVAKVLDFGAAKVTRGASTRSTLVGPGGKRIIGTPAYMSPEHLRGARVDPRTDSYAIGTIGIELLWTHPFSNPDGSMPETYEMVRRQFVEPPAYLCDVAPHVPRGVADLLGRALAKSPEDRPSVAEMAAGLRLERTKYKAANPEADSAPFAREWTGPGSWASHGPAVSLPQHAPAPADPSRSVVVRGPGAPVAAGATVKLEPVKAAGVPSSAPGTVAGAPPSGPGGALETPVSAPPRMTVVPVTVGPENRASHPAQVRARRTRVLVFLAVCSAGVLGGAVYFLAGASPRAEGMAGSATVPVPAAPPLGGTVAEPLADAGTGDAAGPAPPPADVRPASTIPSDPTPTPGTTAAPAASTSGGAKAKPVASIKPPASKAQAPSGGSKPSGVDLPFSDRSQQPK